MAKRTHKSNSTRVFTHFLGIDISKAHFDYVLWAAQDQQKLVQGQFCNNSDGFFELLEVLRPFRIAQADLLVCMEATGRYGRLLAHFMHHQGFATWEENPQVIKAASGLGRGKTDAMDAFRIAQYAARFQDRYRPFIPLDAALDQLDQLFQIREAIVEMQKLWTILHKDLKTGAQSQGALQVQTQERVATFFKTELRTAEQALDALLAESPDLQHQYELINSVPGVGRVTALYLIFITRGFTRLNEAPKLKCYAGVVPFEHQSGSSIRGKARLSPRANKVLKKYLHLCAVSVIRLKGELREYYERKVAEGKNKMLVINNIRAKLIDRIIAVVTRQKPYEKNYPRPIHPIDLTLS